MAEQNDTSMVKISFQDLNYSVTVPVTREEKKKGVKNKTKKLEVLKGVTGYCLPG